MANEKSNGNTLIFNWNSSPIACKTVSFATEATMEDTTTTATAATGTESTPIRVKGSITVEALGYDGGGDKMTGNTLAITFGGTANTVTVLIAKSIISPRYAFVSVFRIILIFHTP